MIAEGVPVDTLLKLCDVHIAIAREELLRRELKDVPEGHPLDLLIKEDEEVLKLSEALRLSLGSLAARADDEAAARSLEAAEKLYAVLRSHYRKLQMLLFPYLERLGIFAVPRVLWAREHDVIVKLRRLREQLRKREALKEAVELGRAVYTDIHDLALRETKILFPALWALLNEGMWAAFSEEALKVGWAVPVEAKWTPTSKPIYPWEVEAPPSPEVVEKLPSEIKTFALSIQGGLKPDEYRLLREGDLDLGTGFLQLEEVACVFSALPAELTFADSEGRVRFYSASRLQRGFHRARTLLGRKFEYCHPPSLENMVRNVFENLKKGVKDYYEFYTRVGDRIIRVLAVAVRGRDGRFLGALEVAEDITDIVERPEMVKKKIQVL